jgi:2-polyprenyl-3-methyl-5-hydroxy-6-metoxy-1,4-benzoquinol methylase
MPSIDWNEGTWGNNGAWHNGGDNWSNAWRGPESQWYGTILPRIQDFLPAGNILEIAPGFGRWTQFLKDACESLTVVDLNQRCIDACQERFRNDPKVKCYANDGKSLEMVPDNSVDFVFSFDSLVHVESDVIQAYLSQLSRKMKKDAVAFVHHSNIAYYRNYFRWVRGTPLLRVFMRQFGYETRLHDRGVSVSADKFAGWADDTGLCCMRQEWINWASPLLIDCFSTFTKQESAWECENRVVKNDLFMNEARCIAQRASLYPRRQAA